MVGLVRGSYLDILRIALHNFGSSVDLSDCPTLAPFHPRSWTSEDLVTVCLTWMQCATLLGCCAGEHEVPKVNSGISPSFIIPDHGSH